MKTVSYNAAAKSLNTFLNEHFDTGVTSKVAEVILWAERHGIDGQGFLKLAGSEPLQSIKSSTPIEIENRSPVSAHIKGNKQPSFYVAQVATDLAIDKAKASGIAVVGANGIFSSTGALGFYAEKIASAGLVGLVMARSPGAIAAFGTKTQLFGTNPLAVSFPTNGDPLVFDMATAAITWYELVLAKMRGEKIPEGVAINSNGELTTDPAAAMDGGILPFDKSYKGSGLAMAVELFSGPLVGASYCDFETYDKDWGLFVLAFKPDLLVDAAQFKSGVSDMINIIRAQDKADGNGKARLPGDRGRAHAAKVLANDTLDVENEIAALLGL